MSWESQELTTGLQWKVSWSSHSEVRTLEKTPLGLAADSKRALTRPILYPSLER